MMAKFVNKNAYEYAIRETIDGISQEYCNKKVNIPFPVAQRWISGWIDTKENKCQICFIYDSIDKVFPHTIIKSNNSYNVLRYSPILDFNMLIRNEGQIVEFFKKGITNYILMICDCFNESQKKELINTIQKEHSKKFGIQIPYLSVEFVPIPDGKSVEDLALLNDDLKK